MVSFRRVKLNLETNFVFDLISLDSRLRLLEYFFPFSESFPKKETGFSTSYF